MRKTIEVKRQRKNPSAPGFGLQIIPKCTECVQRCKAISSQSSYKKTGRSQHNYSCMNLANQICIRPTFNYSLFPFTRLYTNLPPSMIIIIVNTYLEI